jgi:hypothetical protein
MTKVTPFLMFNRKVKPVIDAMMTMMKLDVAVRSLLHDNFALSLALTQRND